MLTKKIEAALNKQISHEADSSQVYLGIASWADVQPGLEGVSEFFYMQSEEERLHMMKLIRFVNERGGNAVIPALKQPALKFISLKKAFETFLKNEITVSGSINELVDISLHGKDYATHNFLQWYVAEQIEEERLARRLNEKLDMIGSDKSGLYLFDRDIMTSRSKIGIKG
ncbi:MAG: ferritin [Bacteroidetes bacterium]|nr:ferritin [Bacteroidota bacterium]